MQRLFKELSNLFQGPIKFKALYTQFTLVSFSRKPDEEDFVIFFCLQIKIILVLDQKLKMTQIVVQTRFEAYHRELNIQLFK